MEISEDVYEQLSKVPNFTVHPPTGEKPPEIPEHSLKTLTEAYGFVGIISYLHPQSIENCRTLLAKIQEPRTPSDQVGNWGNLNSVLEKLGMGISQNSVTLIVAQDPGELYKLIKTVCFFEGFKKRVSDNNGGVFLDEIDPHKPLFEADSCLEFLLLSFCRNFELAPRHSAALLAQDYKYLAHIVAKGLKGKYHPVVLWLQDTYASTDRLVALMMQEKHDSIQFTLKAFVPGFLSRDTEVVQWSMRLIGKIALEIAELGGLSEVWNWLVSGEKSPLEVLIQRYREKDQLIGHFCELLGIVGEGNYTELYCFHIRNLLPNVCEYLNFLSEIIPVLSGSEILFEEISGCGVLGYWVELGLKEGDSAKTATVRASVLVFLSKILVYFYGIIGDNHSIMNSMFSVFTMSCRDSGELYKSFVIGLMFSLLRFLADVKSALASSVYKTLIFILIENYESDEIRELIEYNLIGIFTSTPDVPVGTLVEPLAKVMRKSDFTFQPVDVQFFIVLAQHSTMSIKCSIQLLDAIGSLHLKHLVFSNAISAPFTMLISRYIESKAMREYLSIFFRYHLEILTKNEETLRKKENQEIIYRNHCVYYLLLKIIMLDLQPVNEDLKDILLTANSAFYTANKRNSYMIFKLLSSFGNPKTLNQEYREKVLQLSTIDVPDGQLTPIAETKQLLALKSSEEFPDLKSRSSNKFVPSSFTRGFSGIEKAKRLHMFKLNKMVKEKEIHIQLWEKPIKKVHEIIPPKINEYIELRDFTKEEGEYIDILLSRYTRVFKVLFNNYSGTGFERKPEGMNDFEWYKDRKSKLNESEFLKMLLDNSITPKLLTKEDLRNLIKSYCHRIAKQADQTYVDLQGFKAVCCQAAQFIYSKDISFELIHPVYWLMEFILLFKESFKQKGKSIEIFDEIEHGQQANELNEELRLNPNTALPEGFSRVPDLLISLRSTLPDTVTIPEPHRFAYDIFYEILSKAVGTSALLPTVQITKIYRVKPVPLKKDKPDLPPVHERLYQVKPRITSPTRKLAISPALQAQVQQASTEDKGIYKETARVLERILLQIQVQNIKVINRPPVRINEKTEILKERQKQNDEKKKQEEEHKRTQRHALLQHKVARAKEKRSKIIQEHGKIREQEVELKKITEQTKADQKKREKSNKEKLIKQWNEKKQEEEKLKNELNKKSDPNEQKRFKDIQKKHKTRLDLLLKEKQEQIKDQKRMADQEKEKELTYKEEMRKKTGKFLGAAREVKEKNAQENSQFEIFIHDEDVNSLLLTHSEQLETIFTHYCKQSKATFEQIPPGTLKHLSYDSYIKFGLQFEIVPNIITREEFSKTFKQILKKQNSERSVSKSIDFEEFKNVLLHVAWNAREVLAPEGISATTLFKLFEMLEVDKSVGIVTKKIKSMMGQEGHEKAKKEQQGINKRNMSTGNVQGLHDNKEDIDQLDN